MSTQVAITLPWSHLAAVMASTAVKDIRHYLDGFAVIQDPATHTLCLCGTDGHRMTIAHTESAAISPWPDGGVIFEHPEIRPKGKAAAGEVTLTIDLDDPKASTIWWPGRSAPLPLVPIEGRYPDVWQIIPTGEGKPTAQIAFNPSLIAPIQKALGSDGCQFHLNTDSFTILIDWRDPRVQTVLMPMTW